MSNEQQELKKRLQAQLVLKSFVASGDINKQTLLDLLNTTSSGNNNIQFESRDTMVLDPISEEYLPSTTYKLSYPISAEQARLLGYMKNATGFKTRAGSSLSIEHDKAGNLFATVTGPDNFSQQVMNGRPMHANMINMEKYAKLDATREFVRLVATSGIYQVNPEMKYLPTSEIGTLADYSSNIKNNLRQLVSDATHIYIQFDKDVDGVLRRDILDTENNKNTVGLGYMQMKNIHFPQSISNVVDTFNKLRDSFPNIKYANPEPLAVPPKMSPQTPREDVAPHGFKRSA